MLSIIISSYQEKYYTALEKNIAETIGIPYEIIKIENPGLMGICEAYNIGAKNAHFDYFLFLHEDVIFHTKNWGIKLINYLENNSFGLVGIAGSNYVPKTPIGWHMPSGNYNFYHFIQNDKSKKNGKLYSNLDKLKNVYAIDGVFMALRKSVYNEFKFNEEIKGFHGYDLDFSLRIGHRYKNHIINNILIEHFSKGETDKTWFINNLEIRKKLKLTFDQTFDEKLEKEIFLNFINEYFKNKNFNIKNILEVLRFLPSGLKAEFYFLVLKTLIFNFLVSKEIIAR